MSDQAAILRRRLLEASSAREPVGPAPTPGNPRVIAVASGKGGVGKSNFCVNFAIGLQQMGRRPIIIDADVGFANVEVLLGVQPTKTLVDVLSGIDILDAVQMGAAEIPFLSAGSGLFDIHSLSSWQLDLLLHEAEKLQRRYDLVLLDCGTGMGENIGRLVTAADQLLVVTTPEPTAITDAYSLLKLLVARGSFPSTQLVINRVHNLLDGRVTADKLRLVARRFLNQELGVLGYILEDDAVSQAVMLQRPLLLQYPDSIAARCMMQLAQNHLRAETALPRVGIKGFFERLFRRNAGTAGAPA